jgi:hypothetical protein
MPYNKDIQEEIEFELELITKGKEEVKRQLERYKINGIGDTFHPSLCDAIEIANNKTKIDQDKMIKNIIASLEDFIEHFNENTEEIKKGIIEKVKQKHVDEVIRKQTIGNIVKNLEK